MSGNEKPWLNLSTDEPNRPPIKIDDKTYHLAAAEDFELEELFWLAHVGKQFADIAAAEDPIGRAKEAGERLDDVTKKVLFDVPASVFDRLKINHKLAIVQAFVRAVGDLGGSPRPDGASSSPDSSDSTAERSMTG